MLARLGAPSFSLFLFFSSPQFLSSRAGKISHTFQAVSCVFVSGREREKERQRKKKQYGRCKLSRFPLLTRALKFLFFLFVWVLFELQYTYFSYIFLLIRLVNCGEKTNEYIHETPQVVSGRRTNLSLSLSLSLSLTLLTSAQNHPFVLDFFCWRLLDFRFGRRGIYCRKGT